MTINQDDFITPITGNVIIQNNGARLVLQSNADLNTLFEGDESFKLVLRKGSNTGPIVTTTPVIVIKDTSNTITYDSLVESSDTIAEGGTFSITLDTTNLGPNNTLYYTITGNAESSLFVSGNTGSFVTTGNAYTLELPTNSLVPTNETRFFQLQIREGSPTGPVKITSNVINVVDSQQAFITATGGFVTLEEGWKTHIFTSSNSFTVSGLGIPTNRTVQFEVIGGGGAGGRARTSNPPAGTGGGAGGYLQTNVTLTAANTISIIIGGGGGDTVGGGPGALQYMGTSGANTLVYGIDLNLNAVGGGGGGGYGAIYGDGLARGLSGGSGGGSGGDAPLLGGVGVSGQGNPGGNAGWIYAPTGSAAGGGGAGEPGFPGAGFGAFVLGARGGNGISSGFITGIPTSYGTPSFTKGGGGRWFAGGGAASVWGEPTRRGIGGIGGGGAYDTPGGPGIPVAGGRGVVNTGGGGNGTGFPDTASGGGSGIVMLRYPYTVKTFNLTDDLFQPGAILQGSNISYSLRTINVSNNSVLYYTTSGNVTTSDFFGGNTGSFTVVNANAIFGLSIANNIVSGGDTKVFALQLREGSASGPVVASANTVTVYSQDSINFISATGGTIIDEDGYRLHVFTSTDTFAVSDVSAFNTVEYLVVAGGGGTSPVAPGGPGLGGGGAGGLLTGKTSISAANYLANVGGGGAASSRGSNSDIFSQIAVGGGQATTPGQNSFPQRFTRPAGRGGSGGGTDNDGNANQFYYGGFGIAGQGFPGGSSTGTGNGWRRGGGGGGAGQAGFGSRPDANHKGGDGLPISWIPADYGTSGPAPGRWFAGGGGAGGSSPGSNPTPTAGSIGGAGGGGSGGTGWPPQPFSGFSGNVNTGGGGGGGGAHGATNPPASTGGSGIVIIRYIKP
jgi:hypothetical protein